jgi:hypothetical protein
MKSIRVKNQGFKKNKKALCHRSIELKCKLINMISVGGCEGD